MTGQQLREIEERAGKATEGPWEYDARDGAVDCPQYEILCMGGHLYNRNDNGRFIANARTDIPALVAEVRERDTVIHDLLEDLKFYAGLAGLIGVDFENLPAVRHARALGE